VRLAVVSDIHGNLAALEAIIADLEVVAPDQVVQMGDVAAIGPRPAEVVDRLRELEWPGVVGNTDEILWDDSMRAEQQRRAPKLQNWLRVLFEVLAPWAQDRLGEDRLGWLRVLPREWRQDDVLAVHASPADLWRAPMPDANDDELRAAFGDQGARLIVYGHIHRPFVRQLPDLTIANSGSVGLPYDGDWRPSYLLVDDGIPEVRRLKYDVEREVYDLATTGFPLKAWLEAVQRTGRFSQP
jgi:putative phosphoesterase